MATKKTKAAQNTKLSKAAQKKFDEELALASTAVASDEEPVEAPVPKKAEEPVVEEEPSVVEVEVKKALLKGAKAIKDDKLSIEDKISLVLAKAMPEMGAMIGMALAKAQQDVKNNDAAALAAARISGERCQVCRQVLPRGCKQGEHAHRVIAVYPTSKRNGKWFMGIRINGIRYLSNSLQHKIPVPADAPIEQMLKMWEDMEDENLTGREQMHDSGSVGPSGAAFNPANARHGFSNLG